MDQMSSNKLNFEKFVASAEWRAILHYVDDLEGDHLEDALNAETMEAKEYHRGAVEILRAIENMPDKVIENATQEREE